MYIDFPQINPIAFSIGPLDIHWYGISYSTGLLLGWIYGKYLQKKYDYIDFPSQHIDDFITYLVVGMLLGGRLGFVLFYDPNYYWHNPLDIFKIWQGGMAFHGALIGIGLAMLAFCKKYSLPFWTLTDLASATIPIGLFLGRIANFINDELYGRVTMVPWAVKFPNGGYLPRHPSQLYEAFTEGLGLLILARILMHNPVIRQRRGLITAVFLMGYGISRCAIEFFREPTTASWGWLTTGHQLSIPMILVGLYIFIIKNKPINDVN